MRRRRDERRPRAHRARSAVGERQIERRGAPITLEVEIGDLGDLRSLGHGVLHRALDQRLIAHRLLIGPRRGHEIFAQPVRTLGALFDRLKNPTPIALDQRPELPHPSRIAAGVNAADALPVGVLDIIAEPRLDPHHHPVGAILAPVGQSSYSIEGSPSGRTRLRQPLRSKSSRRRSHSASSSGATSPRRRTRSPASHAD